MLKQGLKVKFKDLMAVLRAPRMQKELHLPQGGAKLFCPEQLLTRVSVFACVRECDASHYLQLLLFVLKAGCEAML